MKKKDWRWKMEDGIWKIKDGRFVLVGYLGFGFNWILRIEDCE